MWGSCSIEVVKFSLEGIQERLLQKGGLYSKSQGVGYRMCVCSGGSLEMNYLHCVCVRERD